MNYYEIAEKITTITYGNWQLKGGHFRLLYRVSQSRLAKVCLQTTLYDTIIISYYHVTTLV